MICPQWRKLFDGYRPVCKQLASIGSALLITGVLLMVMEGCSAFIPPSISGSNDVGVTTLTQSDNGKSVQIQVGDRLVIQLKENPTTGYQWTFNQTNQQVLAFQNSEYTSASAVGVGGGGRRIFTFKGQQVGTTELHFNLWREWQGDSSAIERFTTTL
jgi:inhibitor of cysteine peptidase